MGRLRPLVGVVIKVFRGKMGNCNNCMDEKTGGEVGIQSFAPAAKPKSHTEKPAASQETFAPDFMPPPYQSDDLEYPAKSKRQEANPESVAQPEEKGDIFEEKREEPKPKQEPAKPAPSDAKAGPPQRTTASFSPVSAPSIAHITTLQTAFRIVFSKRRLREQESRYVDVPDPAEPWTESYTDAGEDPESLLSPAARVTYKGLPPYLYSHSVKGVATSGPRTLGDGSIYVGQWASSGSRIFRKGKGRLFKRDGSFREGYWCGAKFQPTGRIIFDNGDFYEGGVADGQRSGNGTFRDHSRAEYKGSWANDKKHGNGSETLTDGSTYSGEFARGVRSGRGTLRWAGGKVYEGDFENNEFTGQGVHTWPDGRRFEGGWLNGKMHGEGTFRYADGKVYKGAYRNDHKHGYGVYEWDGNKYEGDWVDGKMHGRGYLTTKEKGRKLYEFKNGEKQKEIKE